MSNRPDPDSQFWKMATPLLARPGIARSTMMGYPCLRLHGDFFASWDQAADHLVVKLDDGTKRRFRDLGHQPLSGRLVLAVPPGTWQATLVAGNSGHRAVTIQLGSVTGS